MCGGNGTWPDGKLDCCANGDTICQCRGALTPVGLSLTLAQALSRSCSPPVLSVSPWRQVTLDAAAAASAAASASCMLTRGIACAYSCPRHGLTCGYWGYYRRTILRQKVSVLLLSSRDWLLTPVQLGLPEPESCFCEYIALCCPIYSNLGIAQQWRAASATKK
jgi:hypothetical protein